jgi:hypothetical protein
LWAFAARFERTLALPFVAQVEPPLGSGLAKVVLRVFGDNTDIFIDRARELKARDARFRSHPALPLLRSDRLAIPPAQVLLQLNAQGFGARVVGTFANGRLEAWLPARPLEPAELADAPLSRRIARLLRRFHAARVDADGVVDTATPLWPLLRQWLQMAASLTLDDPTRQAKLESVRACGAASQPSRSSLMP